MKRKMTDLALPGKCGGLAASGLTRSAAFAGGSTSDASAREPKPCAARTRTSRRVNAGRRWGSWDIEELVAVEECQAEIRQRTTRLEKFQREAGLIRLRLASERQLPGGLDGAISVRAAWLFQPRCEGLRGLLHEAGVEQSQRLQGVCR